MVSGEFDFTEVIVNNHGCFYSLRSVYQSSSILPPSLYTIITWVFSFDLTQSSFITFDLMSVEMMNNRRLSSFLFTFKTKLTYYRLLLKYFSSIKRNVLSRRRRTREKKKETSRITLWVRDRYSAFTARSVSRKKTNRTCMYVSNPASFFLLFFFFFSH